MRWFGRGPPNERPSCNLKDPHRRLRRSALFCLRESSRITTQLPRHNGARVLHPCRHRSHLGECRCKRGVIPSVPKRRRDALWESARRHTRAALRRPRNRRCEPTTRADCPPGPSHRRIICARATPATRPRRRTKVPPAGPNAQRPKGQKPCQRRAEGLLGGPAASLVQPHQQQRATPSARAARRQRGSAYRRVTPGSNSALSPLGDISMRRTTMHPAPLAPRRSQAKAHRRSPTPRRGPVRRDPGPGTTVPRPNKRAKWPARGEVPVGRRPPPSIWQLPGWTGAQAPPHQHAPTHNPRPPGRLRPTLRRHGAWPTLGGPTRGRTAWPPPPRQSLARHPPHPPRQPPTLRAPTACVEPIDHTPIRVGRIGHDPRTSRRGRLPKPPPGLPESVAICKMPLATCGQRGCAKRRPRGGARRGSCVSPHGALPHAAAQGLTQPQCRRPTRSNTLRPPGRRGTPSAPHMCGPAAGRANAPAAWPRGPPTGPQTCPPASTALGVSRHSARKDRSTPTTPCPTAGAVARHAHVVVAIHPDANHREGVGRGRHRGSLLHACDLGCPQLSLSKPAATSDDKPDDHGSHPCAHHRGQPKRDPRLTAASARTPAHLAANFLHRPRCQGLPWVCLGIVHGVPAS